MLFILNVISYSYTYFNVEISRPAARRRCFAKDANYAHCAVECTAGLVTIALVAAITLLLLSLLS